MLTVIFGIQFTGWATNGIVLLALPLILYQNGVSSLEIGSTIALFSVVAAATAVLFGRLSDRLGRRIMIIVGFLLPSSSSFLLAFDFTVSTAYVAMVMQGLGIAMFEPSTNAAVGDIAKDSHYGRAFGTLGMVSLAGGSMGPVVGGVLIHGLGFSWTFLASGILFSIVVPVAFIGLRGMTPIQSPIGFNPSSGHLSPRSFRAPVYVGWSAMLTSFVAWGALRSFFPVYGSTLGYDTILIGGLFSAMVVVGSVTRIPVGYLLDRSNRSIPMIMAGLALTGISLAVIGVLTSPITLFVVLSFVGFSRAVVNLTSNVVIARGTDKKSRGFAMGLTSTFRNLGSTIGPLLTGIIIDLHGFVVGFMVVGGLILSISIATQLILSLRIRSYENTTTGNN